jgi:hypothetical protein
MTAIHTVAGSTSHFPDFVTGRRLDVIRDAASKIFYFTTIATVFAFVLILTVGSHP